jgi:very-short-patch-repair endonuclease
VIDHLHAVAASQGGVIAARQAASYGYTRDEIAALRTSGRWAAPRRGIYLPGERESGSDPRIEAHIANAAAALLAVQTDDAVIAHVSGAVLWELDWAFPPDLDEVWLARPVAGKTRRYPGLRILPAQLPTGHVTVGPRGLRTCTPTRVVVDLARRLTFRESVVLAESAVRRVLATGGDLEQVLFDCTGWPYARRAARAIAAVDGSSESAAEALARAVFLEAGLPTPRAQVELFDRGGAFIARVDFLFEQWHTIVEIDGRGKYTDPDVLWREKRREDRLRELGYRLVRLSWSDLLGPLDEIRRRILPRRPGATA